MTRTTDPSRSGLAWLSHAALILLLALVVSRAITMEFPRDPFPVTPGGEAIPRGVSAAAGALLDWLCIVPALLILTRRLLDRSYRLNGYLSFIPLILLSIWSLCSIGWSDDRFIAAIGISHWWAGIAILFAASQLVRSWRQLRIIAAVICGLLFIFIAQGLIYQYQDLPLLQETWQKDRQQVLAQRGWSEDSFSARQFEQRILSGNMSGFSASPNTFAAALMMAMVVTLGAVTQRFIQNRRDAAILVPLAGFAVGWWLIHFTQSKAGLLTPAIALIVLLLLIKSRTWLRQHIKAVFWCATALILLGFTAVIAHGIYHGSLPTDSMNFRWRYWVGSWHLFENYPITGVGWNNFGDHYLRYRLPVAAEEIKDPHNLFVRMATELGIVGLALCFAWLLWLAWEMVRPTQSTSLFGDTLENTATNLGNTPSAPHTSTPDIHEQMRHSPLRILSLIGVLMIVLNILATIDFAQGPAYLVTELLRRFLFLCAFFLGSIITLSQSLHDENIDTRPAPWILYAAALAGGLFLIHNLIDFSMFDTSPGAMLLFTLITGVSIAGSFIGRPLHQNGSKHPASSLAGWAVLPAVAAWVAIIALFVSPLLQANAAAERGDNAIRASRFSTATREYLDAAESSPLANEDYFMRAAAASIRSGQSIPQISQIFSQAIAANKASAVNHAQRARFLLSLPDRKNYQKQIVDDFTTATQNDPIEVSLHIEFASALALLDQPAAALDQYRLAIHYNDLLPPDEPKRLTREQLQQVDDTMQQLQKPDSTQP